MRVVRDPDEIVKLLGVGSPLAFDIETTGLRPDRDKLVSLAFKPARLPGFVIDTRGMEVARIRPAIARLFREFSLPIRGHNLVFDLHWMLSHVGVGIDDLRATFYDTMLVEQVIQGIGLSEAKKRGIKFDMLSVGASYGLSVTKDDREWFIDLDKREEWGQPFPENVVSYMRQDVSIPHSLAKRQAQKVAEYQLEEAIALEAKVLPATAGMQHYGIAINQEEWLRVREKLDREIPKLAEALHKEFDVDILAQRREAFEERAAPYRAWKGRKATYIESAKHMWGKEKGWGDERKRLSKQYDEDFPKPTPPGTLKDGVNLNSKPQIKIALNARGYNFTSLKAEAIAPFAEIDPLIEQYMEYTAYTTIYTRYNAEWIEKFVRRGKIYPQWRQLGTGTGRYSCSDPNLQQIPGQGVGKDLRKTIVPSPGYRFVVADFSNVELRIAMALSGDQFMEKAFRDRVDLHTRTAESMFGLDKIESYRKASDKQEWADSHDVVVGGKTLEGVSYRKVAKKINFMVLYGGGVQRLSAILRIPLDTTKELFKRHRKAFHQVMDWIYTQGERLDLTATRVYSATRSGRRRWYDVPKFKIGETDEDQWRGRCAAIRRQLANAPIQGLSADVTKEAIGLWHERYNCEAMHLVMAIHDELIIEVRDEEALVARAKRALEEVMCSAMTKYVPEVDPGKIEATAEYWWRH